MYLIIFPFVLEIVLEVVRFRAMYKYIDSGTI